MLSLQISAKVSSAKSQSYFSEPRNVLCSGGPYRRKLTPSSWTRARSSRQRSLCPHFSISSIRVFPLLIVGELFSMPVANRNRGLCLDGLSIELRWAEI